VNICVILYLNVKKRKTQRQHHFRYWPVNRSVTGRLSGLVKSLL